ncbi:RE2, partial [Symbiodinium necroappetens]
MPEEYKFNKAISLDVFIIKDTIGRRYKVMSIVDLGTLFHVAAIVGEGSGPPSSGDMAHALSTCWLNWAGIPESIVLDRGLENRGKLQQLVTAHGILLRYIGVESAYQLGRGERQGGILKEVIKSTVHARQLRGRQNMEFVVTESVSIKNHRINHNGFSPAQWVLGRNPPEIDALTNLDTQARLGTHQEILDGESSFAQQMLVRGAARESFAQVDSSQRIRSSLLRKSVPSRGPFVMGDLVCYYKNQGAHRQWKWYGPARVIGQEGKGTLWIVHGGVPLTVSVEQCRHATGNEMLAKRVLELRPSRKRRREDVEDNADVNDHDNEVPFVDDLVGVGGPPGNEQPGFFDMRRQLVRSPPKGKTCLGCQNYNMLSIALWMHWMEFPAEDRDHQEGYLLKGQSKELHYHKETDAVKQGIDNARLKEWGNWQGFEAVDIILPEDVPAYLKEHKDAEITPTRWVDNNKAQPWEDPRYKSRIVVRGDLETGAEGARTDSPTASSMMFNLLLSITANKRWRLRGGDITASFLQGDVITRTLILRPPPGGLPGVPEGALLRARKPVYGTKDAPRGFWKRLHRVALSKGLRAIPGEHAAYVLQDKHHGLQGIVIAHVDDLLWSGSEAMDKVMDEIIKEFKFGALEFGDKFDYCGRTVEQGKDGITIT